MSRTQDVFGGKGGRGTSGCKINAGSVSSPFPRLSLNYIK